MAKNPRSALSGVGRGSVRSIFSELGKVSWPSFSVAIKLSIIVLFLSGVLAVVLGLGFDSLFTWFITVIGGG